MCSTCSNSHFVYCHSYKTPIEICCRCTQWASTIDYELVSITNAKKKHELQTKERLKNNRNSVNRMKSNHLLYFCALHKCWLHVVVVVTIEMLFYIQYKLLFAAFKVLLPIMKFCMRNLIALPKGPKPEKSKICQVCCDLSGLCCCFPNPSLALCTFFQYYTISNFTIHHIHCDLRDAFRVK